MKPVAVLVGIGMRVCVKLNVRGDIDFVNEMVHVVVKFDPRSFRNEDGLILEDSFLSDLLQTAAREIHAVFPFFPFWVPRTDLPHVSTYFRVPEVPDAAYTSMSRVSCRSALAASTTRTTRRLNVCLRFLNERTTQWDVRVVPEAASARSRCSHHPSPPPSPSLPPSVSLTPI